MTELTFIELRRIRKNLKSKVLSHCFENLIAGVCIIFPATAALTWLMPRCASGYQPDLA